MNNELLQKAMSANTAEELFDLAKENGIELSEESAKAYFEQIHSNGEISDEELENVAGGGCYSGNRLVVTTITNACMYFACKCGKNQDSLWQYGNWGIAVSKRKCLNCGATAGCNQCSYITYENGLWLCNNPNNMLNQNK